MTELWERKKGESAKAHRAFCDYCDLGTSRSLRLLHEQYTEPSFNNPITTSRSSLNTWSAQHDWQERVKAWEANQVILRNKAHDKARTQIIEDELFDYNQQLEKWKDAFKRLPLHEVEHIHIDENGNVQKFVKLNYKDLHEMTKWRDDIAKQGRRALGLPDKITEQNMSGSIGLNHAGKVETISEFRIVDYRQSAAPLLTDEDMDIDNVDFHQVTTRLNPTKIEQNPQQLQSDRHNYRVSPL